MSKVVRRFCFCNMFLQTTLIGYCLTKNRLWVYCYINITFTVALPHQAWSGPDTPWWLSQRTGTCFVSTSLLEVQVPPSSSGSGGLWPTCLLYHHLNARRSKQGKKFEYFLLPIDTTRIWRRRKSRTQSPEGLFCHRCSTAGDWKGDFILGTTRPSHLHIIPSCLHNIHAITLSTFRLMPLLETGAP